MRPVIYLFILCASCFHKASAQSLSPTVLSAAGDVNTTDHVQLEWTLGELAVESVIRQPNSYTEGFHQPFLVVTPAKPYAVHDTKEQEAWIANVTVAPNPVATSLTVQFKNAPVTDFQMILSGPEGQFIRKLSMPSGQFQQQIDLASLPAGMYYLDIQSTDSQARHAYVISKIQ